MAKKKSTKKPAAKKKAPAVKAPAKKAVTPTPTPIVKAAPISTDEIGHTAGSVWVALHESGPLTIAALKKATSGSTDATLMAIGWLAREGKLEFTISGKSVKVTLR